jgi:2,3-bisphosphoglycerate-dependent phosphoglycerate mutase
MYRIVFLRHGQSSWNEQGLFAGWSDTDFNKKKPVKIGLTERGKKEAKDAAKILLKKGYIFDLAFTSYLYRAIETLDIVLEKMDLCWIPVIKSWKLNEKHYGNLQGLSKKGMVKKVGFKKVLAWRRGYSIRPPKIKKSNKYYTKNDLRYGNLKVSELPLTESLEDVVLRTKPYWEKVICPEIKKGKKIIISGHGNGLRAIIKLLDKVSDKEIAGLNIPTGIPLVYELDKKFRPIKKYYLASAKKIAELEKEVKDQIKI